MTVYLPGQRIVLIHTNDPHTLLRPGALGTVRHHDQHTDTVAVGWDDGSTLSMLLADGDRIALANTEASTAEDSTAHADENAPVVPGEQASTQDGQIAYVTELPPCVLHQLRGVEVPAGYDAALRHGQGWAYLCDDCFRVYAVGLGVGRGQRLIVRRPPGETPPTADA